MIRLPRFKRSPDIPAFQLTDRDREILCHVHRHRFLRSSHLAVLTAGSKQQMLRRLQMLYHHGYLERPRCQIDYYHKSGSNHIAYGLGNKGAAWLKRELSLPFHHLDWKRKNCVGRLFLEHALLISDIMVAVELACRNQPDIRLLLPDENKLRPFQWDVEVSNRVKCSVIPDRVFGLEFTENSGQQNQSWFFLEADRATMPVVRGDLKQSSVYRKLLAYEATWAGNIHMNKFQWNRFRVLTVTNTDERIATLQKAVRSLRRGHGLFLFMNKQSLNGNKDFFAIRWQTSRENETEALFR